MLSPVLIFAVVAFIDLPVALVMLGFALVALFAPALWHKWDVANAQSRQTPNAHHHSDRGRPSPACGRLSADCGPAQSW